MTLFDFGIEAQVLAEVKICGGAFFGIAGNAQYMRLGWSAFVKALLEDGMIGI